MKTPDDEATLQASIHGVEKKPLPHLLCVTNMMLHGIDVPVATSATTTRSPARYATTARRTGWTSSSPTRPSAAWKRTASRTTSRRAFRTRETADLFLVLIMHLLKPGGRAAIVLPDGTLFGEGIKTRIKEKLLEECNLHTIVRLPNGVFAPTPSIKTNLLFFTKGEPTKDVWFYEHPYPAGAQELLQDQAHADRGVRAREEVVGQAQGDRPGLEGLARRHQGARLQPRHQESARHR